MIFNNYGFNMKYFLILLLSSMLFVSCKSADQGDEDFEDVENAEEEEYNQEDYNPEYYKSKTLYFNSPGATGLSKNNKEYLIDLSGFLKAFPDVNISVIGHANAGGSMQRQETRSNQRAESVANFLVSLNIARHRILYMGKGAEQLVSTEDTDEAKAKNRRVEINVIE